MKNLGISPVPSASTRSFLAAALAWSLLTTVSLVRSEVALADSGSYATSNTGIKNVQASSPAFGGATDRTGACVSNEVYDNHLTNQNAFVLFLSNYNLGQNPANDQQQFPGTVPNPAH